MKNYFHLFFLGLIILLVVTQVQAQRTATSYLLNPKVEGSYLTFEVYAQNTTPSTTTILLGSSSFYFDFTATTLSSPTISELSQRFHFEDGNVNNYGPMSAEIIDGKLAITVTHTGNDGGSSTLSKTAPYGEKMCKVSFLITDPSGTASVSWDNINSAISPSNSVEVVNSFSGGISNMSLAPGSDLVLSSTGDGSGGNLYTVKAKTKDNSSKSAGSAGFYIYYLEGGFAYTEDKLHEAPFQWPVGTVTNEINFGSKTVDGVTFTNRLKYTNSNLALDGDNWGATEIDLLAVRFVYPSQGMRVYLEPIEATSFTNVGATTNYLVEVNNAHRQLTSLEGALPITLTNFSAVAHPHLGVVLKWTTAMEQDNREFIVQRSSDGKTFTDVKTIPGAGNSKQTRHYTTTDDYPLPGTSYYRLMQVDLDGTTSYSKAVAVKNNMALSADPFIKAARPNPFQNKTEISFHLPVDAAVALTLSDALGKVIATDKVSGRAGANTYSLKGDHLANGIYLLTLHAGSESSRFKLVKNR